jgi:hypothetical protein
VGSSLKTLDTNITSSRSVNQPLGLNQVLDFVGAAGMLKKDAIEMVRVIRPLCGLKALSKWG